MEAVILASDGGTLLSSIGKLEAEVAEVGRPTFEVDAEAMLFISWFAAKRRVLALVLALALVMPLLVADQALASSKPGNPIISKLVTVTSTFFTFVIVIVIVTAIAISWLFYFSPWFYSSALYDKID